MEKATILCEIPECNEPATHKIAAPWRDKHFSELKTYGFACAGHVPDVLDKAEVRWLEYNPVPSEVVGEIAIYHFEAGKGDRNLERDREREELYLA